MPEACIELSAASCLGMYTEEKVIPVNVSDNFNFSYFLEETHLGLPLNLLKKYRWGK
jgi:hypothetical protein